MAARKKVTRSRTTKKPAPAKAKVKVKAKAKAKAKAPAKKKKVARAKAPAKKKAARAKASAKVSAKKPKKKAGAVKAAPRATPKVRAKTKATAKPAATKPNGAILRRDATGHLNPQYAADLRARSRESAEDLGNDNAFLRKSRSHDSLAEELGEEAVATMTSGEDQSERMQDLEVEEERGGPFVTTSGREEYAGGTDKSNPFDATREPFPTT